MGNPVEDSSVGRGEIALPLDSSGECNAGARRRKFRLRAFKFCVFVFCSTFAVVAFWKQPPSVRMALGELIHGADNIAEDPRLKAYQTPESAEYCAEWDPVAVTVSGPVQLASASFELPTAADLVFFLARGPVSGHINIIKTPSYSMGPIEVNVTAEYKNAEDLERTKVCRMGLAHEHGVLVWHPHGDPRRDVRINITVALPTGVKNYRDVTTDLPLFQHDVGDFFDMWSPTSFEVIRLKASNAAINHGDLMAESLFVQTSNAKIKGFFGGLELSVQTSNAPIASIAMMYGANAGSESRVNLKTSNGAISAMLGLASDFTDNVLRAVLQTSGASINIVGTRFMADNSSFFLDASTSVGPATLRLDPEYEGTYNLQTSLAQAQVEVEVVSDPSRQGRNRTVTKTSTGQHAQGSIYWSHDGEPTEGVQRGSVKVTTSKSPVTLYC
ncbi:hypothetical protein C8R44DRAFT_808620 [Mycena epipterygia]|nr:hypothetical protein C8R44DRAFT_808620 [Mycena epipterygia]